MKIVSILTVNSYGVDMDYVILYISGDNWMDYKNMHSEKNMCWLKHSLFFTVQPEHKQGLYS
jgi:hypothetical protein